MHFISLCNYFGDALYLTVFLPSHNAHFFVPLFSLSSFLLLYVTFNLLLNLIIVWAAKVPTVPVQMAVTSFGNQKGLIVCMDDSGGLSINYMGE